jgi:hypothetical protein
MNQNSVTTDQILYAQAFQIAITLKGGKPFIAEGNDFVIERALEDYRSLANSVFRFLRAQGV